MRGPRAALALLTRIPTGLSGDWPRYTVAWFWLPGFMAGAIWYLSFYIFGSTTIGMICAVGGEALLTGGMHWRALAGTFDGWAAGPSNRRWTRRSHAIGGSGALFIGLALLAFWTMWQHGSPIMPMLWILPPVWGRALMAWGTTWRQSDPSSAWMVKLSKATKNGVGSWIPLLITIGFGVLLLGFQSIEIFGATLLLTGLYLLWGRHMFRGLNEEVLFSSSLVAELISLYFLVAMAPRAL